MTCGWPTVLALASYKQDSRAELSIWEECFSTVFCLSCLMACEYIIDMLFAEMLNVEVFSRTLSKHLKSRELRNWWNACFVDFDCARINYSSWAFILLQSPHSAGTLAAATAIEGMADNLDTVNGDGNTTITKGQLDYFQPSWVAPANLIWLCSDINRVRSWMDYESIGEGGSAEAAGSYCASLSECL